MRYYLALLMLAVIVGCEPLPQANGCPDDAKLCPDGTFVGRVPPDCDFEECPEMSVGCPLDVKTCPDGTVLSRVGPDCLFPDCPPLEKVFCEPDQRGVEACIALFDPVCGYYDGEKIQCIKAPCAQTYSNSCVACADDKVLYYEAGECPE